MVEGLVSVITPCYNGAKYVGETIKSVMAQSYSNWEMLIIDDGSTDNSTEVISSYTARDKRIHLIRQANSGSAVARNNGIDKAEGQYIALLDADDLWRPSFLANQIAFMKEKGAACVCCAYARIDERSGPILSPVKPLRVIREKDMLVMNRIGCLSGLYDASKHGKVYLRPELKSIRDDYAYWLDIVRKAGVAYGNPEVLADYRVLRGSTTGNKKKLIKKQYTFYRDFLKLSPVKSAFNTVRWGIAGAIKFSR